MRRRDKHRMGADAVARDAAGGVGGGDEERGGQPMMRVAWRTSVLVAFCLLTSTATAHAECAWVMWTEERHADGGPIKLSASDAFDTREQCKTRLANTTSLVGKGLGGRVVGNVVIMSSKEGKPSLMFTYLCLPDTVDPRGPKGK
jgi:hypothetical protein